MSTPTPRFFEFGTFKIDTVERVLLRNDQPVILTQKVFDLLRVVIRSISGSSPPSYFDIEPSYFLRWTPDGQYLAYAQNPQDKKKGQALWLQPVSGGQPHQILDVAPDLLYWIAWSREAAAGVLARQVCYGYGFVES